MGGRLCTSIYGRIVRVIVACALVGGLTAACATANPGGSPRSGSPSPIAAPSQVATPSPTATPSATPQPCVVGVSWFNASGGDIPDWEEPALQKAVLDAGAVFLEKNDKSFVPGQGGDIDALVAAGAKVIVVEPGMGSDYSPGRTESHQRRDPGDHPPEPSSMPGRCTSPTTPSRKVDRRRGPCSPRSPRATTSSSRTTIPCRRTATLSRRGSWRSCSPRSTGATSRSSPRLTGAGTTI